jgi:hypothetical protein
MMEKPTRRARALTVRLLFPLSVMTKMSAEARLPIISRKAMATSIFIDKCSGSLQPETGDCVKKNPVSVKIAL